VADRNDKNKTGRTVALVGGGALLLWLLLRGRGWGLGEGTDHEGTGSGASGPTGARPARCRVRIDADGIELDGAPTDLETMTARCQAAGSADVHATGAAITGVVAEVIHRLRAAGVEVWADSAVWNSANVTPTKRSA